jgi:glycosyltransferase involved in cell wall biosynthesis
MLKALAESFRLPERKRVIANGRSIPAFDTGSRILRAVTAGRLWDEAKDIALLGAVRSPMPLVVAGETECDGTRAGMLESVELRGALCEEEMLRLFTTSAVYVCTSRYEPFGLAPLEAALCGCAVVAREIVSLHEVWGDAALYFSDAKELSDVLTRLANMPELLAEAQRRAGDRARLYTRKRMTEEYRALYAQILAKILAEEPAYVA